MTYVIFIATNFGPMIWSEWYIENLL